jgi:hypothetical protein
MSTFENIPENKFYPTLLAIVGLPSFPSPPLQEEDVDLIGEDYIEQGAVNATAHGFPTGPILNSLTQHERLEANIYHESLTRDAPLYTWEEIESGNFLYASNSNGVDFFWPEYIVTNKYVGDNRVIYLYSKMHSHTNSYTLTYSIRLRDVATRKITKFEDNASPKHIILKITTSHSIYSNQRSDRDLYYESGGGQSKHNKVNNFKDDATTFYLNGGKDLLVSTHICTKAGGDYDGMKATACCEQTDKLRVVPTTGLIVHNGIDFGKTQVECQEEYDKYKRDFLLEVSEDKKQKLKLANWKVLLWGCFQHCAFVIMPMLHIDLFNYRQIRHIPLDTLHKWVQQLLSYDGCLRELNIYNLDLKLENVLVDSETMNLWLCDLGGMFLNSKDLGITGYTKTAITTSHIQFIKYNSSLRTIYTKFIAKENKHPVEDIGLTKKRKAQGDGGEGGSRSSNRTPLFNTWKHPEEGSPLFNNWIVLLNTSTDWALGVTIIQLLFNTKWKYDHSEVPHVEDIGNRIYDYLHTIGLIMEHDDEQLGLLTDVVKGTLLGELHPSFTRKTKLLVNPSFFGLHPLESLSTVRIASLAS